jgi:hypothetical protein
VRATACTQSLNLALAAAAVLFSTMTDNTPDNPPNKTIVNMRSQDQQLLHK